VVVKSPTFLRKALKGTATLYKDAETYTINCEVMVAPRLELDIAGGGIVVGGGTRGYFLPKYLIEGKEVKVEEGDELEFKGRRYSIVATFEQYVGNELVFLEAELELL